MASSKKARLKRRQKKRGRKRGCKHYFVKYYLGEIVCKYCDQPMDYQKDSIS